MNQPQPQQNPYPAPAQPGAMIGVDLQTFQWLAGELYNIGQHMAYLSTVMQAQAQAAIDSTAVPQAQGSYAAQAAHGVSAPAYAHAAQAAPATQPATETPPPQEPAAHAGASATEATEGADAQNAPAAESSDSTVDTATTEQEAAADQVATGQSAEQASVPRQSSTATGGPLSPESLARPKPERPTAAQQSTTTQQPVAQQAQLQPTAHTTQSTSDTAWDPYRTHSATAVHGNAAWPGWGTRQRFGSTWEPSRILAWIGAGVTLLGVVFLLILAAQAGWLGPEIRLTGGAVLASALIGAGLWLHQRSTESEVSGRIVSFALTTTGFSALFLNVVAATAVYHYVSNPVGLGLGLVVAISGLALADWWRAQPLAMGVLIGSALCAPLITQSPNALLVGFLVLLQIACTPVQARRGWAGLALTAEVITTLVAISASVWDYTTAADKPGDTSLAGVITAGALLGIGLATYFAWLRPEFARSAVGMLVAAPLPVFVMAPLLLDTRTATAIGLGLAALLAVIWLGGRFASSLAQRLPKVFVIAAGGLAALALGQSTFTWLNASSYATALLLEALILGIVGLVTRGGGTLIGASVYAALGFGTALYFEIPPPALFSIEDSGGTPALLAGALTAIVAIGLPLAALSIGALENAETETLWIVCGLIALYGTAHATMAACLIVSPGRPGFMAAHILITLSWVVIAVGLLMRGVRVLPLRIAGMVLIAVSLAKLVLYDLGTLDGFARVLVFLCCGLLLLASGAGYARLLARIGRDEERARALAASSGRPQQW